MDRKQALARAMSLCSQKEYCEAAVRSKLKFWGAEPADIDSVIEELIREKFIDDLRYAAAYARDKVRLNQWGRMKIRYMLSMERVSHAIIEQALDEIDEEIYSEALSDLLEKKSRELKRESNPYTRKQKLIKFAQSHGFETDLILKLMKSILGLWILLLVMAGCTRPAKEKSETPFNWGKRQEVTFSDLKKGFASPDMAYAPFVFWFWDEPLNPEKMAEMARTMASQGFNPGYAHARHSMVGTPSLPDSEWLGERWFTSFRGALAEAENQKGYLGYCDEYWWPSFQANGRVLKSHPELRAESLRWRIMDVKPGTRVNIPESFFTVAASLAKELEPLPPSPVLGKWIWMPGAEEKAHECWFRHSFELPADNPVKQASVRMTADNSFTLFINGKNALSGDNWEKPRLEDVTAFLVPGSNSLALKCGNLDGPSGLIGGLQVILSGGDTILIATDENWKASLNPGTGWETADYRETGWKPVRVIGPAGSNPWSAVTNEEPYRQAIINSQSMQLIGSGNPFTWTVPDGNAWRIYVFEKYFHPGAADGQKCNSIDTRLASAFIDIALEPYRKEFGDKLGRSIPGDFIDHEGDYGWKVAWSGSLDSTWQERFGTDIRLALPMMLDQDQEGSWPSVRWKWFDLVSDLYAGVFREITDWHENQGMYTTAHVWEESLQSHVHCVGDHLKILRSLTMPGQDCLGLKALKVHDFKEPQSVAEFGNVRFASEVLGASDFERGMGLWGCFTPALLKKSANAFTAWGVSHTIPHGLFATRELKGNPWPPDWYTENPMFPWLNHWTWFVRRASYINSMGHAVPDVLLYNPLETAWMHSDGTMLDAGSIWQFPDDHPAGARINAINKVYSDAISDLTDARVEFLVGDRYYLNSMSVRKGRLQTGPFSFSTLILPETEILSLEVARKMVDFARSGGYVFALGTLPSASVENGLNDQKMKELMDKLALMENFTLIEGGDLKDLLGSGTPGLTSPVNLVSGSFPMLQHRRRISGMDFYWLANNTEQAQNCLAEFRGSTGTVTVWDCEKGTVSGLPYEKTPDGIAVSLAFKPLEAFWIVIGDQGGDTPGPDAQQGSGSWQDLALDGLWQVKLSPMQEQVERASQAPAFLDNWTDKSLADWKEWGMETFSGLLMYRKTVTIPESARRIILDLGKVGHAAAVEVNSQSAGSRLWGPYEFDITDLVKSGENEIVITVANLVNNSWGDIKESGLAGPVKIRYRP